MSAVILPLDLPAPRRERRHPRLRLPIEARIDGRTYRVADWSVAGLGLLDVDFPAGPDDTIEVELGIALRSGRLGSCVRARVCYHERFRRRAGLEFLDLAPPQRAMLQFVVDEHLAGQILDVDGLLEFAAGRTGDAAPALEERASPPVLPALRWLVGRSLGLGLVLSVGLGASAYLGAGLYRHLFAVETASAEVTVPDHSRGDRLRR